MAHHAGHAGQARRLAKGQTERGGYVRKSLYYGFRRKEQVMQGEQA